MTNEERKVLNEISFEIKAMALRYETLEQVGRMVREENIALKEENQRLLRMIGNGGCRYPNAILPFKWRG